MKLLIVSAVLAFISCVLSFSDSICITATGGKGECKSILQCASLLTLRLRERTTEETNTLKRSICDNPKQKEGYLVCCPAECYTPDGDPGTCINVNNCQYLYNLLEQENPEVDDYVYKHRCRGKRLSNVCCSTSGRTRWTANVKKTCELSATPPHPTKSMCCGESEEGDRIIGGNDTAVDQYPWLAVIEYTTESNKVELMCGGALISGKYVLTAAHCLLTRVGTPINVRLGEYNTANEGPDCVYTSGDGVDCTTGMIRIPIESTITHPDYHPDNSNRWNDIALIRLNTTASYTEFIRPICLPTIDVTQDSAILSKGFRFWVSGWGATSSMQNGSNIKQHVAVPFVSTESCEPKYSLSQTEKRISKGQLCAGGKKREDSCLGDSGGPLMNFNNKKWEVTGIVSYGIACGEEDIPAVYTNVFHYVPWIKKQIKS